MPAYCDTPSPQTLIRPHLDPAACEREPEAHVHAAGLRVLLAEALREPDVGQLGDSEGCEREDDLLQWRRTAVLACGKTSRARKVLKISACFSAGAPPFLPAVRRAKQQRC